MKTSKFSESQIVSILKQKEAGQKVAEICREHGISQATFYKWRSKYGGMDASMLKRVKELEQENAELKKDNAKKTRALTLGKRIANHHGFGGSRKRQRR